MSKLTGLGNINVNVNTNGLVTSVNNSLPTPDGNISLSIQQSNIEGLTDSLNACEKTANKGVTGGYCPLNSNTKIDSTYLPTIPSTLASLNDVQIYPDVLSGQFMPSLVYDGMGWTSMMLNTSSISGLQTALSNCEKTSNK